MLATSPDPVGQPTDRPDQHRHDYAAHDLVKLLAGRATRPWVAFRLNPDSSGEFLRVPSGACVTLAAAPGGGKSSFALQVAWIHALTQGPAVYASLELDADEAAARLVAQRTGASWEDALSCRVPAEAVERALDLPRLHVLDWGATKLDYIATRIRALRCAHPGEPILMVLDYIQIAGDLADEAHSRVTEQVEHVRKLTKELDAVTIILSQCSRDMATQLESGGRQGARTTTVGAESAQLERAAHATLALGDSEQIDADTKRMKLSIGKNRMGAGDRVIPVLFNGRTGLFQLDGQPRPSAEVADEGRDAYVERQIASVASKAPAGFASLTALVKAARVNKSRGLTVARGLVTSGRLAKTGSGRNSRYKWRSVPGSGS